MVDVELLSVEDEDSRRAWGKKLFSTKFTRKIEFPLADW